MKWAELKNKPKEELLHDLSETRARLVDMRFKAHAGSLKQVHLIRQAKSDASRILTRLSQLVHTDGSPHTPEVPKE
ncbi:MAG: 50S ribosomal protein L29 [Parcubacteria group bacterium]|nr:50S ribosomal protein L29 [Parcubacteria group bacterium]